jgi:hypothetical protein
MSFSSDAKLGCFSNVAKAPIRAVLGAFSAASFSYRCQKTAVRFSIVPERATYRPAAALKDFSADHIPENSHGSVLHWAGPEMLAIAFALDVLNDFGCARDPMALAVNNLKRLAHVEFSDPF